MIKYFLLFSITVGLSASTIVKDGHVMWYIDEEMNYKTTWNDAQTICSDLQVGTDHDWRLPKVIELHRLIDIDKFNPAVKNGLENSFNAQIWSSTGVKNNGKNFWIVDFKSGSTMIKKQSQEYYFRCVREY